MLIRVKERGSGIRKIERTKREKESNEKEEKREEEQSIGKLLA